MRKNGRVCVGFVDLDKVSDKTNMEDLYHILRMYYLGEKLSNGIRVCTLMI